MTKYYNLAVFFDGTWNTVDSKTNVLKMKELVRTGDYQFDDEEDSFHTDAHYEEGPGTTAYMSMVGGALAVDLDIAIGNAYAWLTRKYLNYTYDGITPRIYLFGFSRGAYCAHILSWILEDAGIPKQYSLCKKIVSAYVKKETNEFSRLLTEERFCPVEIKMLGLWDVVTAPFDLRSNYHDGKKAPSVGKIYHAMAANEKRDLFPVMKYTDEPMVEQCWFSGAHSDVGGGYADDSTLSDACLEWMMTKAYHEDLDFIKIPEECQNFNFSGLIVHDENPQAAWNRNYEDEEIHHSLTMRLGNDYQPEINNFPQNIESEA